MAPVAAFQQVAVPQEAVGVPVADGQGAMQRRRLLRHGVGLMLGHCVAAVFDIAGAKDQEEAERHQNQEDDPSQPFPQTPHDPILRVAIGADARRGRPALARRGGDPRF